MTKGIAKYTALAAQKRVSGAVRLHTRRTTGGTTVGPRPLALR